MSLAATDGLLSGTPTKSGTWNVVVEAKDSLKVKAKRTVALGRRALSAGRRLGPIEPVLTLS